MAKYKKKLEEDIRCPLEYELAIFGGKWKSRIICVLAVNEKLRYSQLRKEMYNITDAVLVAMRTGKDGKRNTSCKGKRRGRRKRDRPAARYATG